MELVLKNIYIYPVKSIGGYAVPEAAVIETGLLYDRRWMLVDAKGTFISQRTHPALALLQAKIQNDQLIISHKSTGGQLQVDLGETTGSQLVVQIWEDTCQAIEVSTKANTWFSDFLNQPVQLVYMPNSTHRQVEPNLVHVKRSVGFADAFQLLIIGEESLNDLNRRLQQPVTIDRFRPNLVFAGGTAYCEDAFTTFSISGVDMLGVKPCVRCQVITINQQNATSTKEPMKTLAKYRAKNNKVLFGLNLIANNKGTIKTGDPLIF